MPRRCIPDDRLDGLIAFQHGLVNRDQALRHGMSVDAVEYRPRRLAWRCVLPKVYSTTGVELTRQQMLIAAAANSDIVRVVLPWGRSPRSTGFVVVRRTLAPLETVTTEAVRYLDAAAAVVSAGRQFCCPFS